MKHYRRLFVLLLCIIPVVGCQRKFFSGVFTHSEISSEESYQILKQKKFYYFTAEDAASEKKYSPVCRYKIYIPKKYSAREPLALMMSFTIEIRQWQKYADQYGIMLMYADCSTFAMASIKEKIIAQYSIDKNKIYLAGFSAGAYKSIDLFFDFPNDYNGSLLASGGSLPDVNVMVNEKSLKNKKFFITLGADDYAENIEDAKKLEKFLSKNGAEVKFELQPDIGHQYPKNKNSEIFSFLFSP